uniref:Peptidase S1 domain-containing protein n=1 Tax=Megaselia scalaris TaxID=36166 RepID=T1H5L5_MEGSC
MEKEQNLPVNQFSIRAGSVNRLASGVIHQIEKIVVNEHHWIDMLNDLALLKLSTPLNFTNKVQPIPLNTEELPADSDIVISGWGLLISNGPKLPERLQYVYVKSMSTAECKKHIGLWNLIIWRQRESILCLKHPKGEGACQGDSGGPAAHNGKLVGVTGFVTGIITTCGSRSLMVMQRFHITLNGLESI